MCLIRFLRWGMDLASIRMRSEVDGATVIYILWRTYSY
jgi:hypothetical protein